MRGDRYPAELASRTASGVQAFKRGPRPRSFVYTLSIFEYENINTTILPLLVAYEDCAYCVQENRLLLSMADLPD